jgi:hypothetical protein
MTRIKTQSAAQVAKVVKQGKERPRPLTLEETERAERNRAAFYADAMAYEQWAKAGYRSPGGREAEPFNPEPKGPEDRPVLDGHGREVPLNDGDFFLNTVVPSVSARFREGATLRNDGPNSWTPELEAIEALMEGPFKDAAEGIIGLRDAYYIAHREMGRVAEA